MTRNKKAIAFAITQNARIAVQREKFPSEIESNCTDG